MILTDKFLVGKYKKYVVDQLVPEQDEKARLQQVPET